MQSARIEWVTLLKFIGIITVILGHIKSPLGEIIYSWHMPFFFILAGFFIKYKLGFYQFINNEFKRLMIPYFIFSMLALVLESIKRLILNRDTLNYTDELMGIFIWMDMDSLINTYAFVLWFLPTLFIARCAVYLIVYYLNSKLLQILFVLALFLCGVITQVPFAIDNGFNAVIFVYIGTYIFIYIDKKLWALLFSPLLILIYIYIGLPKLDLAQIKYSNIFFNILWSVSFSSLLVLVTRTAKNLPRIIVLWGGNTMLLFIFHPYTNNFSHIFLESAGYSEWYFKLFISLLLLHLLLLLKMKFSHLKLFKYV